MASNAKSLIAAYGNGAVELEVSSAVQLDDVMYLVAQSFERNVDNGEQ